MVSTVSVFPLALGLASRRDASPINKGEFEGLLKSFGYRCGYCSFLAMGTLKPSYCEAEQRWVPACPLCYDSMHLDIAEVKRPNGCMIALEGVNQASINAMINTYWMLQHYDDESFKSTKEGLIMMLSKFDVAINSMRNTYGKESHELELFVSVLENLPNQRYQRREKIIAPVRYLNSNEEDYQAEISYWAKAAYPRLIGNIKKELEAVS